MQLVCCVCLDTISGIVPGFRKMSIWFDMQWPGKGVRYTNSPYMDCLHAASHMAIPQYLHENMSNERGMHILVIVFDERVSPVTECFVQSNCGCLSFDTRCIYICI